MVMKSVSEIGGIPRNRSTPSVLHAKGGGINGREGGVYGELGIKAPRVFHSGNRPEAGDPPEIEIRKIVGNRDRK
jgi:hypothetical protein